MANYGMVFLPSSSSSTPYTTGVAPVVALVSLGDTPQPQLYSGGVTLVVNIFQNVQEVLANLVVG